MSTHATQVAILNLMVMPIVCQATVSFGKSEVESNVLEVVSKAIKQNHRRKLFMYVYGQTDLVWFLTLPISKTFIFLATGVGFAHVPCTLGFVVGWFHECTWVAGVAGGHCFFAGFVVVFGGFSFRGGYI
jgi:hypothetical protein